MKIKQIVDRDHRESAGKTTIFDIDLSKNDGYFEMDVDMMSFSKAAITISGILGTNPGGGTPTSGTIVLQQANERRGKSFALSTPVSLIVNNNDTVADFDLAVSGRWLKIVPQGGFVWGTYGRLIITITAKR